MLNTGKIKSLRIPQLKSRSLSSFQMSFSAHHIKEQLNNFRSPQNPRRITTIYEICSQNLNHSQSSLFQHNFHMLSAQMKKYLSTISPKLTLSLGRAQQSFGKMNQVKYFIFFLKKRSINSSKISNIPNSPYCFQSPQGDSGYTTSELRFRVMGDCWFALLRHYLRVDDVLIRIYDTRYYHEFGKNYILREFQVREDTY